MDLTSTNTQLQKTLSKVRTHETELEAKVSLLLAQLLSVGARETALQYSLNEDRRVNEARLA